MLQVNVDLGKFSFGDLIHDVIKWLQSSHDSVFTLQGCGNANNVMIVESSFDKLSNILYSLCVGPIWIWSQLIIWSIKQLEIDVWISFAFVLLLVDSLHLRLSLLSLCFSLRSRNQFKSVDSGI